MAEPALVLPDRDSPEYARLLRDAQMRLIHRARHNPADGYEYVMREETTRARIHTLPFQRLVFDFQREYQMCLVRLPVGGSKTYMMSYLTLDRLGSDPTSRGAIISATSSQAKKPLNLVRNYIEQSAELRAIYPQLRPSQREGDPWTQDKLTVDRPFGIRDPSLVAVGVGGALPGSRLSWILIDDILDLENTRTPEQRANTKRWFTSTVMSRRDLKGANIIVINTPWVAPTEGGDSDGGDEGDLTYYLERVLKWPTLEINVYGEIRIINAPNFDSDLIRPSDSSLASPGNPEVLRLVANDNASVLEDWYRDQGTVPPNPERDDEDAVSFWPEKFTPTAIAEAKANTDPRDFAQNYEMRARSSSEDKLKEEWIRDSKNRAKSLGVYAFVTNVEELQQRTVIDDPMAVMPNQFRIPRDIIVSTGVDLGVGKKQNNARTVMLTLGILPPDNRRLIMDIEAGRWSGKEIIDKLIAKHEAFGSIIRVENNAAQDFLIQWARDRDKSLPVRAHTTGKNKADPRHGVESIFIEIEQGAWLFPCNMAGKSPKQLEALLQALRQYEPGEHTSDYIMAMWFADVQAKKSGGGRKPGAVPLAAIGYR